MSVTRPAHGARLVAVLGLVTLLPATAQTLLIPALPELADRLGTTADAVAWTVTGYLITASVGTPVFGRLGDMFGRRLAQLWALGLFAAGSVICAVLTDSLPGLIVGRMLQGCVGGVFALGIAILRDERPAATVGRDIGVLSALVGVGTSAGFVLGGVLADHVGLRLLFWAQLAACAAAAVMLVAVVPETPREARGRVDVRGAVLLFAGVALPLVAFSRGSDLRRGGAVTLALLLAGGAVLLAWRSVERRTPEPLIDMTTLSRPTVRLANVATFLIGGAMFGLFVLTPQLVQADPAGGYGFGLDATGAGLVLLPGGLLMLVAGPLSGALGRRLGHHVTLAAGGLLAAVGLVCLAVAHSSVVEVVVFGTLASAGLGMAFPAMPNLVVAEVRTAQVGEVAGFNALLRGVGSSVGTQVSAAVLAASAVAGTVTPAAWGYEVAYLLAAAAGAAAAAVMLRVATPSRQADNY